MLPHMLSGISQIIWKMLFLLQWESMQRNEDPDGSASVSNRAGHGRTAVGGSLALKHLQRRKGHRIKCCLLMFFPLGQLYAIITIPYVSVVSDSFQGTAHIPIHSGLAASKLGRCHSFPMHMRKPS